MKRIVVITMITGIFLFVASIIISLPSVYNLFSDRLDSDERTLPTGGSESLESIKSFSSVEDFREYIDEAQAQLYAGSSIYRESSGLGAPDTADAAMENEDFDEQAKSDTDRYSSTNVQVSGIDEPDIVKTDGETIFFSPEQYWLWDDVIREETVEDSVDYELPKVDSDMDESIPAPQPSEPTSHVISALPPENLRKASTLSAAGDFLLSDNVLLVLNYDKVQAFDVSDETSPVSLWEYDANDSTSINTSRLYGNSLYLVTQEYTDYSTPCPIEPLLRDGDAVVSIGCSAIYHPASYIETDSTYSILKIDPHDGRVLDSTSFVASAGSSVVYMSTDNIYVTYTYTTDYAKILIDFLYENGDLFTEEVMKRIRVIDGYELSAEAMFIELQSVLSNYEGSLQEDERTELDNELQNRMDSYLEVHNRELQLTGIAKISVDSLEYTAVGSVPGYPLNQFALDEYEGNLRIATTIGGGWWWGFSSTSDTANDVYVLDDAMRTIGSVTDLGITESIYSVRFIGDAAYVVTYLQVDPFYVIDLSNPRDPKVEGELKIPGYSSYLHPIDDTTILGIGQEDWQVKLSLFDVTNPELPQELSKYTLNEYWSEVNSNHHAFMIDPDHKIFFLPAGSSAFIFSYDGGTLQLVTVASDIQARRALYIDDYLYVIGDEKIVVLDENTWERLPGELAL